MASSFVLAPANRSLGKTGHREIHVVAAQQQVFADGDALQLQLTIAFGDGDQSQVCGAAADIDDQNQITWFTCSRQFGLRSIQA